MNTPSINHWNNRTALIAVVVAFMSGLIGALAFRTDQVSDESAHNEQSRLTRIHWRVPLAFATNLPSLGDNILYVSNVLNQSSGGRVVLEPFEPGELVPTFNITESVRSGKTEAGYTWLGYDQGKIPATPLVSAVPFGMEPWEFTAWYFEDEGKMFTEQLYKAHNIHPVLCGLISPETAGWFRTRIKSLDDFRGLKIRFAGLGGKVLQRLGASVTMIPGSEIFQALEKGAIDATEFSLPVVDQRLGFNKVASYNYYPGWHQTFTAFHLVINQQVWDGLLRQDQALVEMACTAGVIRNLSRSEALQGSIIEQFPVKGVIPLNFDLSVLEKLREVTEEVLAEEAAKDPDFARIYASQQSFRRTYNFWKNRAYLPRDF